MVKWPLVLPHLCCLCGILSPFHKKVQGETMASGGPAKAQRSASKKPVPQRSSTWADEQEAAARLTFSDARVALRMLVSESFHYHRKIAPNCDVAALRAKCREQLESIDRLFLTYRLSPSYPPCTTPICGALRHRATAPCRHCATAAKRRKKQRQLKRKSG